jgi:hypothetical protein
VRFEGCGSRVMEGWAISRAKTVRGDSDPPGRDLCQLVRLLIVPAGHVIELDAVEFVLEGSHGLAVCFHLIIVAARIFHDLVNHELQIPPHVEALDAYLDGDLEAAKEGLVLSHVVRRGEVETYCILHVLPER